MTTQVDQAPSSGMQPQVMTLRALVVERENPDTGEVFRLDVPAFDMARGDCVCLTGRSGSGKTTFLEMLGLLAHPQGLEQFSISPYGDGRMMSLRKPLLSQQVSVLSAIRARTMGFVLQDGGLLPYLSVEDNAMLAAELAGHGRTAKTRAHIRDIAEAIGIGDLLQRLPARLSGGERQRTAVLRGLAPQPRILIADEPTGPLDPETSQEVLHLLVETARVLGVSVIMASHNAELARAFGFTMYRVETHTSDKRKYATLVRDTEHTEHAERTGVQA